eukprot:63211-Chlamydomonas_euryale.AAC.1
MLVQAGCKLLAYTTCPPDATRGIHPDRVSPPSALTWRFNIASPYAPPPAAASAASFFPGPVAAAA